MNPKILIIYYSWSGNTKKNAQAIQQETNGELFEIKPVKAYSKIYNECLDQAKQEIKAGLTPELIGIPDNIEKYDTIFIGSPIWWHTMAPPILTVLKHSNLSGKTIIPFCTHGGGGEGKFPEDIVKHCKKSNVLKELVLFGDGGSSAESKITNWIEKLKY